MEIGGGGASMVLPGFGTDGGGTLPKFLGSGGTLLDLLGTGIGGGGPGTVQFLPPFITGSARSASLMFAHLLPI